MGEGLAAKKATDYLKICPPTRVFFPPRNGGSPFGRPMLRGGKKTRGGLSFLEMGRSGAASTRAGAVFRRVRRNTALGGKSRFARFSALKRELIAGKSCRRRSRRQRGLRRSIGCRKYFGIPERRQAWRGGAGRIRLRGRRERRRGRASRGGRRV